MLTSVSSMSSKCRCLAGSLIPPEAYSEPIRTSTKELLAKIVSSFWPLTIFVKGSILDVRLGSEYTSDLSGYSALTTSDSSSSSEFQLFLSFSFT